jgi:hypothetical protein
MQKTFERLDSKVFQAVLAGLTQITRIASTAHGVWAAVAWAAALRVDDNIKSAAANCFADQAVIVALAVAGRCVEKIDPEIERAANGGDSLCVVRRTIDPRHAVTAETDGSAPPSWRRPPASGCSGRY